MYCVVKDGGKEEGRVTEVVRGNISPNIMLGIILGERPK